MANTKVRDPRLGQSFKTWEEAKSVLNAYSKKRNFVYSVDSSNLISAEKKKLAARGIPEEDWYDTALKYKYLTHVFVFLVVRSGLGQEEGFAVISRKFFYSCLH